MQTLEAMLRPKVSTLPGHIQAVYVQNAAKLFAAVLRNGQQGSPDGQALQETIQLLTDQLPIFVQSADLEVQERVSKAGSFLEQDGGEHRGVVCNRPDPHPHSSRPSISPLRPPAYCS